MGLKGWLIPQERQFFDLLEQIAATVAEGAQALQELLRDFRNVAAKQKHIKDIEHRGDELVHTVFEMLNKTFITPIDREDIIALASSLDSTLDMIDAATNLSDAIFSAIGLAGSPSVCACAATRMSLKASRMMRPKCLARSW